MEGICGQFCPVFFFLLITCDGTTVRQINSECCDTVFGFDQGSDNKQTLIGSFKILLVRKLKERLLRQGGLSADNFHTIWDYEVENMYILKNIAENSYVKNIHTHISM